MAISVVINAENRFPAESSFAAIRSQVFRVETRWQGTIQVGTGFAIARLSPSNRMVIATAAHVLDFPKDAQVDWKVQEIGRGGVVEREAVFQSSEQEKNGRNYDYHKKLDVGCISLPTHQPDGNEFARPDENGLVSVRVHEGITTGTRIAWAGFPKKVEKLLGHPELCYFEGTVSTTVDTDSRCLYLVDGHVARGVSGGPVWHWSDDHKQVEIVGIVSRYGLTEGDIPGLCMFEPINPVIIHVQSWNTRDNHAS